jgi:hypothetical protein
VAIDFAALEKDGALFARQEHNVWLMDDHRWAICAWEERRNESGVDRLHLVHVDYHWDACDDYRGRPAEAAALLAADLPALRQIVAADELIRYDSFIAPAVRRRMLAGIHFLCRQADTDVGLPEDLLQEVGSYQHVYDGVAQLVASQPETPYAFDLCLDYFCDAQMEGAGPV